MEVTDAHLLALVVQKRGAFATVDRSVGTASVPQLEASALLLGFASI